MKVMTWTLSAVAALLLASSVDAEGVCYDPDHVSGKSTQSVQTDMAAIKQRGFNHVRTYISKFGNTNLGDAIVGSGLTAMLGVPYPQGDYRDQMEAAISTANKGGVDVIMIGNENLAGAGSVPGDMISVIQEVKSRVGGNVKVGTVQRNTEFLESDSVSGFDKLVEACDVVGVNIHPFFTPGTQADKAIDVTNNQWNAILSGDLPDIRNKLYLTETGWPSSGSTGGNTGTTQGAANYFNSYQQWSQSIADDKKFYFQMYDVPSRSQEFERTYGLLTANGQDKYTNAAYAPAAAQPEGQTLAETPEQTPAETPTEAPTEAPTDAPTEDLVGEPVNPATEELTDTPTDAPTESLAGDNNGESNPTPSAASTGTSTTSAKSGGAFVNVPSEGSSSYSSSGSNTTDASCGDADSASALSSVELPTTSYSQDGTTANEADPATTATSTNYAATADDAANADKADDSSPTSADPGANEAKTKSSGATTGTTVGVVVGCGAAAAMAAFGFIYQARRKAKQMEEEEEQWGVDGMGDHGALETPTPTPML